MALFETGKLHTQSTLNTAVAFTVGMLRKLIEEITHRLALRQQLSGLSERDLRDVGMTAEDRASLRHMPLTTDSIDKLSKSQAQQARNW